MMTIEERAAKAARRAAEERVRPVLVAEGHYLVASSSQPGHGYLVHVDIDGTVACTCPAAQWDYPCKHAAAVRRLELRACA